MHPNATITRNAVLSADLVYRYTLERVWDVERRQAVFVGLNPSTADALTDDPTIRRCMGFAERWGFGGFHMVNLFAFRATDPAALIEYARARGDVVGPETDDYLREVLQTTVGMVVAMWGAHPSARRLQAKGSPHPRETEVLRLLRKHHPVHCFGVTKDGSPKHPLYLANHVVPEPYTYLLPPAL